MDIISQIIEEGIVAEYDGKFWGIQYKDGEVTAYGYGPIENAGLSDPVFCKDPTYLTWNESGYIKDLQKTKLVKIQKRTIYIRV